MQLVTQGRVGLPVASLCAHPLADNAPLLQVARGNHHARSVTVTQHVSSTGKSKKEDGVKEEKRKRDSSTQPPKSSKPSTGGKSTQQPSTPQQAPPGQPQQGAFVAHKEIKLTLLNKVRPEALAVGAPGNHTKVVLRLSEGQVAFEIWWLDITPARPPALTDSPVRNGGAHGQGVDRFP